MSTVQRNLKAIGWGLLPAALAFGMGAWAMSPSGMAILVSSTMLSLTWWLVVPLGIVISTTLSRRWWPGMVVALGATLLFHLLIVLSRPIFERAAAITSPRYLLGALGTMLLPIAIGLVLSWASIARRRVHYDGTGHDNRP